MLTILRIVTLTTIVGRTAATPALNASDFSPVAAAVTTTMTISVTAIPVTRAISSVITNTCGDGPAWQEMVSTTVSKTARNAVPATITIGAGYEAAAYADGNIIRAPRDCNGKDTYLGVRKFVDGKFDAGRCVEICRDNKGCHFVNTWTLRKNGTILEQHCALYSKAWPTAFLTLIRDEGLHVEARDSYGFTLDDGQDHRVCVPAGA
ncbi:hypothetical protein DE146DRAFT_668016 [Phaeosphaeria sp. MPI-PUGE-AT-0046c]|nr:hypothetical protein DE146DRAFT_668016 [Phaeosphaeria sp. MPI-PUGE-AT-0046c]